MVKKLIFLGMILLALVLCTEQAMALNQLKGHWKLDFDPNTEPNTVDPNLFFTALDEVGPGNNNGTLQNGTVWTSGKNLYAVDFDGTDDYVDMGYAPELNMGTGNVTITAWVKFGAQVHHGVIAGKGIMSNDSGYGLIALSTGQVCLQARQDNISYREVYSNDTDGNWVGFVNDEQWHHVVGILEREQENGTRIYVDGVLQTHYFTDAVSTIGWTYNLDSDTARFCLGARQSDIMPGNEVVMWYFDGSVDDVQVYNYVLSQESIDFLYANPGVVIPDPVLACGDWGYLAMDFDQNCYVDLADFAAFAGDWMKCTDPADPDHCIQVN